jgi:hypothetical protein
MTESVSRDPLLEQLLAKEAIRELGQLYSRGVDRKDFALLRTLYTQDGTDTHGHEYDGSGEGFVQFLEQSLPNVRYGGHHICNHLISVDGDEGEGEVYAIAYHVVPDGQDGWLEDLLAVRYIDRYRKGVDGRWRFAKRVVVYDHRVQRPCTPGQSLGDGSGDASYATLSSRLFARGPRA